jgi:hypothetical protein
LEGLETFGHGQTGWGQFDRCNVPDVYELILTDIFGWAQGGFCSSNWAQIVASTSRVQQKMRDTLRFKRKGKNQDMTRRGPPIAFGSYRDRVSRQKVPHQTFYHTSRTATCWLEGGLLDYPQCTRPFALFWKHYAV